MRQEGAHAGYVRCARLSAPLRAVGEREAQLTVTRSSQSISPFAPPAFTGFDATTRRSDFCMGVGRSSLPPSSLPLEDASNRGPTQTSQGKDTEFTAAPVPTTAPTSVGFWASRSRGTLTRSARPAQGFTCVRCCSTPKASSPHRLATVQLPSACGCYQLAPQRTCTSYPGSMPGTRRCASAAPPGRAMTLRIVCKFV